MTKPKLAWLALHAFNLAAIAGFYTYNLNRTYPWVGQDFSHFIPRLLDTYLHIKINGPLVQWYTANFGGGLPAFANPQHLQFSLPQWLMLCFDPWQAFLFSVGVYVGLGYIGAYKLLRVILQFDRPAATLGAIFWSLTGFYLSRMLVGHFGFLSFPLLPLMLYLLLESRLPLAAASVLFALLSASLVYSAGFYTAVIFAFSGGLSLPLISLMQPQAVHIGRMARRLVMGAGLALLLSGSKLYAVFALMRFFSREVMSIYDAPLLQKVTGIFFQLVGVSLIVPLRLLQGRDPNAIRDYLAARTGIVSSLWELDSAVSGLAVIILGAGLAWHAWRSIRSRGRITKQQAAVASIFALVALALIQYIVTEGPVFDFLKSLPLFRSMHVNIRNTSAFILPICLGAAYYLNEFFRRTRARQKSILLTLNMLALIALFPYLVISPQLHLRFVEIKPLREVYWQMRAGETFPIQKIGDDLDIEAIDRNASSLFIYEPIFGYELEYFHPLVVPGSIYLQDGEYLNMTNPASLVYPEENGLTPFERFKVSERDKLEQFANRRQPYFKMPFMQHVLNIVSAAALGIHVAVLLWFGWKYVKP